MEPNRRAVVDVGTNSIKLLVAEVCGNEVRPLWEESRQTRLGQGFYETHRLQPGPITNTAQAVAAFAAQARELQARTVRVIATSAARDARNAEELTAAIEQASGLKVEIISGEQEAHYAFLGVTTDPALAREPLLLLDVGGGSTEFILGQGQHQHFRHSFPLGTVRLMEKIPHSDPPRAEQLAGCRQWLKEFFDQHVQPRLRPAMDLEVSRAQAHAPLQLVGTGGTATILGCMEAQLSAFDRQRVEATRLSLPQIQAHAERLWQLPLEERKKTVGLPANRADVILTGVAIYEAVLQCLSLPELRLSTRGVRFAAVLDQPE
ncbi:MAG TPA: hypothetical protein VNT26_04890 [Candidatus Sulfotelmatobacter sp.]|nr:hypothetical protein [Candidatus Sulfotelmatobacter sp.]